MSRIQYNMFLNLFLGTKTRQKKFIHGLRKTPKLDTTKPKKALNLGGIIQSTIKSTKAISPTATNNSENSLSSLVSADYESSSSD